MVLLVVGGRSSLRSLLSWPRLLESARSRLELLLASTASWRGCGCVGTHDYDPQYAELRGQVQPSMRGNPAAMYATYGGYDLPTTLPQAPPPTAQDMYIYARPVPKSSRMRALAEAGGINPTDKHPRSAEKQVSSKWFLMTRKDSLPSFFFLLETEYHGQ